MGSLMKADFYKLFRQRSFYICIIIAVSIAIITVFMTENQAQHMKDLLARGGEYSELVNGKQVPYQFPTAANQFKSTFGINGLLFVGILAPLFITVEYRLGTIKNMLSKGFKRSNIFISKLIVTLLFSLLIVLLYSGVSTIMGMLLWGFGQVDNAYWVDIFKFLGIQLYLTLGLTTVYVMVSFLISSIGGAIAINILGVEFASLGVFIIEFIVKKITQHDYNISQWLITTTMGDTISAPIDNSLIMRSIIVATSYIIVSIFISLFVFKKKDIK